MAAVGFTWLPTQCNGTTSHGGGKVACDSVDDGVFHFLHTHTLESLR